MRRCIALILLLSLLLCACGPAAVTEPGNVPETAAPVEPVIAEPAGPATAGEARPGAEARTPEALVCVLNGAGAYAVLQRLGEELWLFLPACADLSALAFRFGAETLRVSNGTRSLETASEAPFDLTALFNAAPDDGVWRVTLGLGGAEREVCICRSASVAAAFLTSPDADHDRTWVEEDKDHKAKNGGFQLLRPDGSAVYEGALKQLKGRGNSTWALPKRPYQLKLTEKTDLMGTGDPAEAETTWVLLADYADKSHLHNRITFDLAAELGLDYTPNCRPVDLWYDGEYRGAYLLCEKTEVGGGRVAVPDLEGAVEDANPDVEDLDDLPTAMGENAYGSAFQYVAGLQSPEEYRAGYLLELDYPDRAAEEKSWFASARGLTLTVKSPEYCSEEMMRFISERWQRFEDALYVGSDAELAAEADLESLAADYLILEFSHDTDAFLSSSFFYLAEPEGRLMAGPVWDFDIAYGMQPEGFFAGVSPFGRALLARRVFREAALAAEARLGELLRGTLLTAMGVTGRLHSVADYHAELSASFAMDLRLWPAVLSGEDWSAAEPKEGLDAEAAALENYLSARIDWLDLAVADWSGESPALPRYMDVWPGQSYFEAVDVLSGLGVMGAMDGNVFGPWVNLSRTMAVLALYRLNGAPEAGGKPPFSDLEPGTELYAAAAWAAETGLIARTEDGVLHGDDPVKREELAQMLYALAGSPAVQGSLTQPDADQVSEGARSAVLWALEQGLYADLDQGELHPRYNLFRNEAAKILARTIGNQP